MGKPSFGKHFFLETKLIYYMGGVDNWFNPQFNYGLISLTENYAYQTLALPMRGFTQTTPQRKQLCTL